MRRTIENVRRGERPTDSTETTSKEASFYVKGLLWIPFALRMLTGVAGVLTFVFAYGKLTNTSVVNEWWQVILPCTIATGLILACTSVAVVLWFVGTVRVVALQRELGRIDRQDRGADSLIRLAKATIATNGWAVLVFLFFWLLGVRLQHGPSIPLIYPFMPLIILGCVHLVLATLLVEPEVDAVRSFGFGLSILVHSIVFILTLDVKDNLENTHWAYVFVPSWATYVWAIVLCIMRSKATLHDLAEAESLQSEKAKAKISKLRQLLKSIIGMGVWAVLFCIAHVLLVLRLSFEVYVEKIQWIAIFVPALLGWIAFIAFAVDPMASCAQECLVELLSIAGVQLPAEGTQRETEATPLLADSRA